MDIEYKCPQCGALREEDSFYQYRETYFGNVRNVERRPTENCIFCRADFLVETNKMPEEFQEAEETETGWDYTAKYRRNQTELARQYRILRGGKSVQSQKAVAAAIMKRAETVRRDPRHNALCAIRIPEIHADPDRFNEWLLENGICPECAEVKPTMDFIYRVKRKHGYRYEIKVRCAACRQKYVVVSKRETEEEQYESSDI